MRAGSRLIVIAAAVLAAIAGTSAAHAGFGQPTPWQTGLQQADTTEMNAIVAFNDHLLTLIIGIAGLVFALLAIVMLRFNARAHPTQEVRDRGTTFGIVERADGTARLVQHTVDQIVGDDALAIDLDAALARVSARAKLRDDAPVDGDSTPHDELFGFAARAHPRACEELL